MKLVKLTLLGIFFAIMYSTYAWFNVWPEDEQVKFIKDRVALIESQKDLPDDEIPECLPTNRWQTETKYAIMKEGRKSAVKLHTDETEAQTHLDTLDKKHYIDIRKVNN